MSAVGEKAESCLVATCAHMSLRMVATESEQAWLDVLREVVPRCADCAASVVPMRAAASDLMHARLHSEQWRSALSRLRHEVMCYFEMAAAHRHNSYMDAVGRKS